MKRPPIWVDFKVSDIPELPGTELGDFVITNVLKTNGAWYVSMRCKICGKTRISRLHNANRTVGRCKHENYGGNYYVD